MTSPEPWVSRDELLVTGKELEVPGLGPGVTARRLRHGLAAVLIPRGLSRAEENQLRTALGVPLRPATRKKPTR
jgi:hypothetical protein